VLDEGVNIITGSSEDPPPIQVIVGDIEFTNKENDIQLKCEN